MAPSATDNSNDDAAKVNANDKRNMRSKICACICCNLVEGSRPHRGEGTFIPAMAQVSGGAPTRTITVDQDWAIKFDQAVKDLASIAANLHNSAPSE